MADSLEKEIQPLDLFLVFRTQHPVAGRDELLGIGAHHFTPVLTIRHTVQDGARSHLAQRAKEVLAAIHFTGIDQHDRLIVIKSQLDDERRYPASTVYASYVRPWDHAFSDFNLSVVNPDRRTKCQRQQYCRDQEEQNSGAKSRSPRQTDPACKSRKRQGHDSERDVMTGGDVAAHRGGPALL